MNPFQIAMIGLAAVLVLSVIWTPLKELIKNLLSVIKPLKKTESYDDSSLEEIIGCWENLKQNSKLHGENLYLILI